MTFAPTFSRPFSPTFDRRNAGGFWWNLFGAIPNANVIAAYQAKGAADLAASYVNLAKPGTNNAAKVANDPGWDATNGWKFATSSQMYLNSPSSIPASGWSMIVQYSNVSGGGCVAGIYNYFGTAGGFAIFPNVSSKVYYYGPGETSVSPALTAGNLAIAGSDVYRDGVDDGNLSGTWPTFTYGVYIGANSKNDGSYTNQLTGYVQAFAIYNSTLSATTIGKLATAMAAL